MGIPWRASSAECKQAPVLSLPVFSFCLNGQYKNFLLSQNTGNRLEVTVYVTVFHSHQAVAIEPPSQAAGHSTVLDCEVGGMVPGSDCREHCPLPTRDMVAGDPDLKATKSGQWVMTCP